VLPAKIKSLLFTGALHVCKKQIKRGLRGVIDAHCGGAVKDRRARIGRKGGWGGGGTNGETESY
jgi:hypothetical protein